MITPGPERGREGQDLAAVRTQKVLSRYVQSLDVPSGANLPHRRVGTAECFFAPGALARMVWGQSGAPVGLAATARQVIQVHDI